MFQYLLNHDSGIMVLTVYWLLINFNSTYLYSSFSVLESCMPALIMFHIFICSFDPPVEFLPGDELRTHCHFQSMTRTEPTYYGSNSVDEMCYGMITYYPRDMESDIYNCEQVISIRSLSYLLHWPHCQCKAVPNPSRI